MAQQVQSRPGSQNDDKDDNEVYDPQTTPANDKSDPRGEYDPQTTPLGSGADLRTPVGSPGNGVYDPQETPLYEPDHPESDSRRPKSTDPRKRLKKKEREGGKKGRFSEEDSFYNPNDSEAVEPSDLRGAEEESGDELYNENDDENFRTKSFKFLKKHKKKALFGGGIGLAVVGGGFGIFMALLPLKLEHIVDNLQGTFFSSSQAALTTETRRMVENYMITRVMPGYKSCGSTIKAGCSARSFGTNPVANMYRSWANARVESKLADRGIVLEYKTLSGKWYLKTPDLKGDGADIGADGSGLTHEIDTHAELRSRTDTAIKDTTKWYNVYTRYKFGTYFERNYGLPRCILFCGARDALSTGIKNKKIAAKLYLTQRVITPRNATLGVALECLIKNCAATDNQPSGADGENGTPQSQYDKDTLDALQKYGGQKLAGESAEELLKKYNDISELGFQKYLITKALTPIIGEAGAGTASDAIPIAGWINFAAQMVNSANDASGNLKKLRFDVNGKAMAAIFSTWLVYANEIHTGNADATEVGSFADSLGPGNNGDPNDPLIGGTAGAEQTKAYQALIENKGSSSSVAIKPSASLVASLTAATAYADSAAGSTYGPKDGEICNNGSPVPSGQIMCSEDFLGGGNSIANGLHDFLNLPGLNVITDIANGYAHTIGKVVNFAGGIVGSAFSAAVAPFNAACNVPILGTIVTVGYCAIKSEAESVLPKIVQGVTTVLIPSPVSTNMGGGRNFVAGAGGAKLMGSDSAHRVLGAQKCTTEQFGQIVSAQREEEKQQFSQQSVLARAFNTDSQYSLMSKVAMDVPLSTGAAAEGTIASLSNPVGMLSHSFGSVFSSKASALDTDYGMAAAAAYGIPNYCYPPGTIPDDPEKYWDEHCSDNASFAYQKDNSWNEAASGADHADPDTGEPVNTTTNPCLLIKATTGSAGGLFDTSNLTKDDLVDLNGAPDSEAGATAPTDTPASGTLPTGTAQDIAKQLVPYVNSGKISCLSSGCPDIIHTANGVSIRGGEGCSVDALKPGLVGLLLGLAQENHTFILSALCSDHHPDGLSLHSGGTSADFNTIDGVFMGPSATEPWSAQKIQVGQKLDQDALALVGRDKIWFGQIQCHQIFSFQHSPPDFDDTCHHQHITVVPS